MYSRRRFLHNSMFGVSSSVAAMLCRDSFLQADDDDGSGALVHNDVARAMDHAKLEMLYDGETAEGCSAWQRSFRATLMELLGDCSAPPTWSVEEQSRTRFDDHVRFELLLHAERTPSLPLYLLIPTDASADRPVPGVLCVHGHGPYGNDAVVGHAHDEAAKAHVAKLNYDYGLQFVRRGYAVAAPCLIPFGRRVDRQKYGGKDPCAVTFVRMQALGRLPIAANLRDLRWSIDLLEDRPDVQHDRIGCAGLSYGGRMTMMASAVDERIKVAAISGALNLMQERMTLRHSCGSQMIPGLLNYGDYSEIGSLIAPRPSVWEAGSRDSLIVPEWDDLFRQRLIKAYESFDARSSLQFDNFEGGHEWSGRIAFELFDRILKHA